MTGAAERGQLELYLEAFQHTVGVMQTRDALVGGFAAEVAPEDLAADGVVYAEVAVSRPSCMSPPGLSLDQVVEGGARRVRFR